MNTATNGALPSLDEGLSAPTGGSPAQTNVRRFALLGMIIGIILFILLFLLIYLKSRAPTENATQNVAATARPGYEEKNTEVESDSIQRAKELIRKEEDEKAAREERKRLREEEEAERRRKEAEEALRLAGIKSATTNAAVEPQEKPETPEERAMRTPVLLPITGTPVMVQGRDGTPVAVAGAGGVSEEAQRQREVEARMRALGVSPASANAGGGGGGLFASSDGNSLGARLKTTDLPGVAASRLPNLDYLLKKGTAIPCALKTGINTQLPGFVLCNVINDVYSANGKTLLVERGATLFGEQQSQLQKGQARTFVIWSRVDNPSGVTADIVSPGTDAMGNSGIPGIIDYHFIERFGAAILLTVVSDFSQAAADRYSERSGSSISLGGDSEDISSMAEEALKDSIGIPPNLIVKPGTVVHVLVARDVTFESVYAVIQ
jgi:type IV secretion system protein VirB10